MEIFLVGIFLVSGSFGITFLLGNFSVVELLRWPFFVHGGGQIYVLQLELRRRLVTGFQRIPVGENYKFSKYGEVGGKDAGIWRI